MVLIDSLLGVKASFVLQFMGDAVLGPACTSDAERRGGMYSG